jgi:hypothetical protein
MAADPANPANEQGVAVVMALVTALFVGGIAALLIMLTTTEALLSGSFRQAREVSYGAEAALERALHDLSMMPDWSLALFPPPANVTSTFDDGAAEPRGPDGRRIVLAQLTAERQAQSDALDGPAIFGADSPRWRLFAHAPSQSLLNVPGMDLPLYLVVWIADDESDGDGDPAVDSNHRITVWAIAIGAGGAQRAVTARVGRTEGGDLRLVTRSEVF